MKQKTTMKLASVTAKVAQFTSNNIRAAFAFALSLVLQLSAFAPFLSARAQTRESLVTTITQQERERGRTVRTYRAEPIARTQAQQPIAQRQLQTVPVWVRTAMQQSLSHLTQRPELLRGNNAATDLSLRTINEDNLGQTHVRLDQYHNGVAVFGGQLITHLRQHAEPFVSGQLFALHNANTTPAIDGQHAIQLAKDALAYAGEFAAEPTAKLIVLPNKLSQNNEEAEGATLVYQVALRVADGTDATAHHQYFINAQDGAVVWHYNSLPGYQGTGHSLYHGEVTVPVTPRPDSVFQLGGNRARIINLNNTSNSENGVDFLSTSNIWGDSTTQNAESAAVDVAYGIEQTHNYFQNIHGRNGYDNYGSQITAYVHYGVNYNNATGGGGFVTFGDGDGNAWNPFVALGTVAHEFTHNVIEQTADLTYANESGALNESFADIFGTAVKFYDQYKMDYLIMDDIALPANNRTVLRSMVVPARFDDPSHYLHRYIGTADNGGVHINSGISNHAFYLLAEGGTHAYSRVQVPGIGRYAAEKIFYRALSEYLTASSKFADARLATVRAAMDLYGYQSPEWHAVHRAWDAVGVGYNRFEVVQTAAGNGIALTGPSGWGSLPVAQVSPASVFSTSLSFMVANTGVGDFSVWAADPAVRKLTGDFNGDGLTDIALIRSSQWSTLPVAFANGDGSFTITNHYIGDFCRYSGQGASILTGDFNGDGKTDIAMTGGAGWGTLPVAFSLGNGAFSVTNQAVGNFARWATEGATAIAGDFNGDGKTDVALTGPGHWNTMPVAYSNGYGGFVIANAYVGDFAKWSAQGAKKVVGDFNRDGKTDIALVGVDNWQTLPVAFGMSTGFVITNTGIQQSFQHWAALAKSQIVAGDFNGDRKTDIAVVSESGFVYVARSLAEGSFAVTGNEAIDFLWMEDFPQIVAADFNRDGRTDLGLTGVSAWNSLPIMFSNDDGTFQRTNEFIGDFATWAATNADGANRAIPLTGTFRSAMFTPR